ncbi:MAG TPA: hypothetical protein P5163_02925 [Rubrivivax sp.]|nr:hypothetical protein [Rubrivivax sp.]HRZ59519.1 hypothetical protein [Rubrivivax sp.]
MTPRRRHERNAAPPRAAQLHLHVARLAWPGAAAAQVQALAEALPPALGGMLQGAPPPVNHHTVADRIAAAIEPQIGPELGGRR